MPPNIPTCTVTAKPHTVTRSPTILSDDDPIAPAQRPMRPPSRHPRSSPAHLTKQSAKGTKQTGSSALQTDPSAMLQNQSNCKRRQVQPTPHPFKRKAPAENKAHPASPTAAAPASKRPRQPPSYLISDFTWPGLKAQTRAQTVVTTKPQLPQAFRLVCQAAHADPQAQQRTQNTVHTTGCWQQKRPRSISPRSTHQRCCKGEQDVAGTAPQPERRSNAEPCLPKIVQNRSIKNSGLSVRNVHLNKTPQEKCLSLSGATTLISLSLSRGFLAMASIHKIAEQARTDPGPERQYQKQLAKAIR
jgi:hypothetical protein